MNEPKRIKWLLESVTDDIDRLNDWERGFVESVERQFKAKGTLSDGQFNVLEKIYERLCEGEARW